jgi:hypothetical protein
MDVIKSLAKDFNRHLQAYAFSLEKYDSELNSKLNYISKASEKIRFLSYLRDMVESQYQEHVKICHNKENCGRNAEFETALYSINQHYDDYFEIAGGQILTEKPAMKFFNEGQYFDAFTEFRECIKKANHSIILIDNYVDDYTLALFPGKDPMISLKIITKSSSITPAFQRAVELYNKQYENLEVGVSENYHDRFLIVDDSQFYHIGASLKDAGNKTFMFSLIKEDSIIDTLRKKIIEDWNMVLQ